jgi:carboxypeptidase C (cathepsin A)
MNASLYVTPQSFRRAARAVPLLLIAGFAFATTTRAADASANPFGEPVVVTHHQARVGGKTLAYSAETGRVAIRNVETGEPHGFMFYIAYRVEGGKTPRPIAFVWNGGPGANSALLHFEAAGPKRIEGSQPVDNEDTWLTATDLVFVDPIGTGFSRPAKPEYGDEFYGTVGDVASVTEFVRAWLILHAAENVPVILAGESWGAGRAGSVGYQLIQRGIPVSGLVLISGGAGLNRDIGSVALRQALRTVDRSATAQYHAKLSPAAGDSTENIRAAAESWVRNVYAPALEQPERLSNAERDEVVDGLSRFTGMQSALIDRDTLVITPRAYREGLLQSSGQVLDVFDMRLLRDAPEAAADADRTAHLQRILSYLRQDLGYRTDLPYLDIEAMEDGYAPGGQYPESVNNRWNYATAEVTPEEMQAAIQAAIKHGGGPPQLGPPLPSAADAVLLDPALKVLVAAGLYDSLNSCAANAEIARELDGALKEAYRFACYDGGHMMYRDELARQQLARDVRKLASGGN